MKTLGAIHATGIDPVELGEILKEGIENGRVIVLPDHNTGEQRAAQLRGQDEQIEDYCLTAAERDAKSAVRMEAMRKMFEERAKEAGNDSTGGPGPGGWGVPEGGEAFGQARADLDWVDPSHKATKK